MSLQSFAGRPRRGQRGASLIEVLVALALVAFTMLGLLALQLRSQGFQKDSIDRRNAAIIASDFLERATANFSGFRNGLYDNLAYTGGLVAAPTACVNPLACTVAEVQQWDWFALQRSVLARLPGGIAFVESPVLGGSTSPSVLQVTVGWVDPLRDDPNLTVGSVVRDPECPAVVTDVRIRCYNARAYP